VGGKDAGFQPNPKAYCIHVQFALTVAALEDKIVQYAVVTILNQIYERRLFAARRGCGHRTSGMTAPGWSVTLPLSVLVYPCPTIGKNVDDVKITTIFLNVFLSTIIIFIPARLLRPWERPGSKVKEWLQLQPRSGPR
jgi:hypothetical protein